MLNEQETQRWFQRRKRGMAIEHGERIGSRTASRVTVHRNDELCLTLAIECGPAVGGYRLTRAATVDRNGDEFDNEAFAAAGGRISIPIQFPRPGYYALSADIVCPVGRANAMIKLSVGDKELSRNFSSCKANPKTIGATLCVQIVVT